MGAYIIGYSTGARRKNYTVNINCISNSGHAFSVQKTKENPNISIINCFDNKILNDGSDLKLSIYKRMDIIYLVTNKKLDRLLFGRFSMRASERKKIEWIEEFLKSQELNSAKVLKANILLDVYKGISRDGLLPFNAIRDMREKYLNEYS